MCKSQMVLVWFPQLGTLGVGTPRALCTAEHRAQGDWLGWQRLGIPNGLAHGRVHADTALDSLPP